jgi:hypothetical protein
VTEIQGRRYPRRFLSDSYCIGVEMVKTGKPKNDWQIPKHASIVRNKINTLRKKRTSPSDATNLSAKYKPNEVKG